MSHLKITISSAMCLSWNLLTVFLYSHNVCMCISILPSVHHFCFPCPNLSHTFRSPFRSLVFLSVTFFVHQKHVTVISHSYCPPFHSPYCCIVLSLSSFTCLIILISVSTDAPFLIGTLSSDHPHVHMRKPHSTYRTIQKEILQLVNWKQGIFQVKNSYKIHVYGHRFLATGKNCWSVACKSHQ